MSNGKRNNKFELIRIIGSPQVREIQGFLSCPVGSDEAGGRNFVLSKLVPNPRFLPGPHPRVASPPVHPDGAIPCELMWLRSRPPRVSCRYRSPGTEKLGCKALPKMSYRCLGRLCRCWFYLSDDDITNAGHELPGHFHPKLWPEQVVDPWLKFA